MTTFSMPALDDTRTWAFSISELTAGLRLRSNDPSLVIVEIREQTIPFRRPARGWIHGLGVTCQTYAGLKFFNLMLKEPVGVTRTGTVGAGRREVNFYKYLRDYLPFATPHIVAAHPEGKWFVMETLEGGISPDNWKASEYFLAIDQLANLHDRFWNLGEDLRAYNWLSRPLDGDFGVYVKAAASGLGHLTSGSATDAPVYDAHTLRVMKKLVENADTIAGPLRHLPTTLIHGDYWPGNIYLNRQGDFVVFDWQKAGIGPAILDLVNFVQLSQWWLERLPLSPQEIVWHYFETMGAISGVHWEPDEWNKLWDYAFLWIFLADWIDLIATSPNPIIYSRYDQLERVWFEPVRQATSRILLKT